MHGLHSLRDNAAVSQWGFQVDPADGFNKKLLMNLLTERLPCRTVKSARISAPLPHFWIGSVQMRSPAVASNAKMCPTPLKWEINLTERGVWDCVRCLLPDISHEPPHSHYL